MKKNDFWVLSLIVFTMIGVLAGFSVWLKAVVIANSLVVLFDVFYTLFKRGRNRG